MALPNLLLPDFGNIGDDFADAIKKKARREAVSAAVPNAISGDPNALAQLYGVDPRVAGQIQAQNIERERWQVLDKIKADETRRGLMRDELVDFGGTLANADTTQHPAIYGVRRAQIVQQYPELAAKLPEQWSPELLPYARALAGIKPQNPAGPTDDMREYQQAVQQGYKGSFFDYQTQLKRAGAANNTVNLGAPVEGVDAQGNPVFGRFRPGDVEPEIVSGIKPAPKKGDAPTQDERQSALLLQRLRRAQNDISNVSTQTPGSERPEVIGAAIGAIAGDTAKNFANSEERQRIEAAQDDALDAALTLSTGAAYTKEQLAMQRRAHFPQLGDSAATAAEKNKRFADLVKDAELRAGRATPPQPTQPKGAPPVGTVKGGYRFKGGNPADPASWEKTT